MAELILRIHYVQVTDIAGDGVSTLALKRMGVVNQNPKQRVPVGHKMVACHGKKKKRKKK